MSLRSSLCFVAATATLGGVIATVQNSLAPASSVKSTPSEVRDARDPWLDAAMRLGLHHGDPTLDRLLARDLRFSGLTGTDGQLASEARRLGLTPLSPSARKRLHRRLEDIILDGIPRPSRAVLDAHLVDFPSVVPERTEWQLTTEDGRRIWLSHADLLRRQIEPSQAAGSRRRQKAPDLDDSRTRALVADHWRTLELRRRWATLEEQ